MNTLELTPNRIILSIKDSSRWHAARSITGSVVETQVGVFRMALSTHNLRRIGQIFRGAEKPEVIRGAEYLEQLREKLNQYKAFREEVLKLQALERYPVAPSGKFIPYAHQTKIVGAVLKNPYSSIFSDCGTGKTGSLARAMEIALEEGRVSRGKILVSAPLSILHTSWADDIRKFTHLRSEFLWTPQSNKAKLGEEKTVVADHGPRPKEAIKTKTKTSVRYRNLRTGSFRDALTVMDNPREWLKCKVTEKVGLTLEGEEIPFGPVVARSFETENTRELFVQSQLARTDVDIFLINHDGVRIYEEVLKAHRFEWVAVDESTKIKSADSKVFQAHVAISESCKFRNILSGTPNPNGFVDLWAQFFFLDRGMTLEPQVKDFLTEYFVPQVVGYYNTPGGKQQAIKHVIRSDEQRRALVDRVRSVGVCLEQRDCIDLPPRTDLRRIVYMTPEQERSYDQMAIDLVTELKGEVSGESVEVSATNVLAKIMKLRQITSGFLLNKSGEVARVPGNPKTGDLDELIEELGDKKLVVAAQFKEEIRAILDRYGKSHGAKAIYGDISVEERAKVIRDFQEKESARLIVLQPQAAAHGITLTAASHLLFTSLDYNFEYYYQTAKRIERLGQKHPIFILHSLARYRDGSPTIDEDLLDILAGKQHDRSALFSEQNLDEVASELTNTLIKQVQARHGKK